MNRIRHAIDEQASAIFFVLDVAWVDRLVERRGVCFALLCGLGFVRGAVIAAIILGFNEALTTKFLGGRYVLMTQFALIIIVLIIRPRGIAGILDKAREA